MAIFISSLLAAVLVILETSFLPFFKIFGALPFITLAYISILAVRYRGFFHFFVALFLGIYFDYISSSFPGTFTAVFVSTVIIGRAVFYRDTGYDSLKSFLWVLIGSTIMIYSIQAVFILGEGFSPWLAVLKMSLAGFVLTVAFGLLLYKFLDKYIDWLNKLNDEKYR